jgi:hypothetical protein
LRCCGRRNFDDFILAGDREIPASCCDAGVAVCNTITNRYDVGCHEALRDIIDGSSLLLAWFSLGFGIAMVTCNILVW